MGVLLLFGFAVIIYFLYLFVILGSISAVIIIIAALIGKREVKRKRILTGIKLMTASVLVLLITIIFISC